MYRILVVEDDQPVLDQLLKLLGAEFPDVQIGSAESVEEALSKIQQAAGNLEPYDLAILDFKLPLKSGENAEVDDTVCEAFRKSSPHGKVIHYTGYPGDSKVRAHMEQQHTGELDEPGVKLIEKSAKSDWVAELQATIRPLVEIYRRKRIATNLVYLFGPVSDSSQSAHLTSGSSRPVRSEGLARRVGDRGISHELAAFKRDVEMNWEILDEPLRDRIRDLFEVQETDGRVSLVLSPRELREADECP